MIKEVVEADSLQTLPKAVWGISLGANLAVKIAKEFTPFISGLIIDSGCTSFEDMAIETYGKENIMVRLAVSSPYPAEKNISKLKEMNLLLIHSPNDTIMPYAMGRKLYREASCNKYFWEVDSRHGYAIADSTERYIQLIGRLFDNDKDLKRKE